MLLLLFVLSVCSDSCRSQYAYSSGGLIPFDPPAYAFRRPPPQRRSAIEALERLRLPVARYFPQVDTQVASAPWAPEPPEVVYPGGASADLYALPPQWSEEFAQPVEVEEQPEYGNYEYEPYSAYRPPQPQAPAYAEEVYPQDPESAEYNDFMESYLMGAPQQLPLVQRRSEEAGSSSSVRNATPAAPDSASSAPTALPPTPQVQVTAVPASPEKKNVKSLVVPDPAPEPAGGAASTAGGQKEEPLFRPLQSSQRTTWSEGSPLSRAKNAASHSSSYKTPIPLLKQMIQKSREAKSEDPLMEELSSLKKSL